MPEITAVADRWAQAHRCAARNNVFHLNPDGSAKCATCGESSPVEQRDPVAGQLEVGVNERGEVVVNHPDIQVDKKGAGYIVFSVSQARAFAATLVRKADQAGGLRCCTSCGIVLLAEDANDDCCADLVACGQRVLKRASQASPRTEDMRCPKCGGVPLGDDGSKALCESCDEWLPISRWLHEPPAVLCDMPSPCPACKSKKAHCVQCMRFNGGQCCAVPVAPMIGGRGGDFGKLRAAQLAVDRLPDGPDKDALTYAVLQWMQAVFIDHAPLSAKDAAWARQVAERVRRG